jgi:hypothetical protein
VSSDAAIAMGCRDMTSKKAREKTRERQVMRVWIVCFILLFGSAELLEWLQKFSLPLPIFVLGGGFLAIASNYTKLTDLPFHPDYEEPSLPATDPVPAAPQKSTPVAAAPPRPTTISFDIKKTFRPKD